ncbi:MAG: glycoside hydrolase family 2 [Actinobacteria bacterium]|nr:MAG: glycoside hydrolase family 2 [Actinomycetota bacterium]
MEIASDTFVSWLNAGYPRPQLCREQWLTLCGPWNFAFDPDNRGLVEEWYRHPDRLSDTITVPYPPGSPLSEVEPVDCDIVWYHRHVTPEDVLSLGSLPRLIVHCEGIDHIADMWINGQHVAHHEGGYTPVKAEVPASTAKADGLDIVIRAYDERLGLDQPRGKQDWRLNPHDIWYERMTGVWRDIWMEAVPATYIDSVHWQSDIHEGCVTCDMHLSGPLSPEAWTQITLTYRGQVVARTEVNLRQRRSTLTLPLPEIAHPHEGKSILWSPRHPNLIDAHIEVTAGESRDHVVSYLGARSVEARAEALFLNDRPIYVRGVLDQGYWPDSYFTPPSHAHLKEDIECALALGFNTVRVHQRTPDQRYLAWADYLGIMVWAEYASAYTFSPQAARWMWDGWMEMLHRDMSHPCITAWVPFNESWGVPHIRNNPQQQAFVDSIVSLTRALDSTRPVIANDGWEQLDTDIVTIHDYATTGDTLAANYETPDAVDRCVHGAGPQGRTILLRAPWTGDKPVIVSEFGGISLWHDDGESWGYDVVSTPEEYREMVATLFVALQKSPVVAGYCYTQLTDTRQETNGLYDADRRPKLPIDKLRAIVDPSAPSRLQ